ncbi:MAG: entericidin A/B family lipoprotein [Alphaproteobacteria bacterium]
MKKATLIAIIAALALSACNTIQGMGEDIGAAGDAISGTATKTKQKM